MNLLLIHDILLLQKTITPDEYNEGVSGFNRCSYCRIEDNDAVRILDKEGNTVMRIGGSSKYDTYKMMYCLVRTSDDNKEYISIYNRDTENVI